MKKKNILYLYLLPFLLAFAFVGSALGQGNGTIDNTHAGQKVFHKKPKWYERVNVDAISGLDRGDLFDADESTNPPFLLYPTVPDTLQAAHELIDTIYVHKGSYVTLDLPFHHSTSNKSSISSYQRWFNYRTGKTFAVNEDRGDLLKPTIKEQTVYRVTNGYIGQPLVGVGQEKTVRQMTFYYPTDNEFSNIKTEDLQNNDYHVVACDVSLYEDFRKDYSETHPDSIFKNTWYEPTLSGRMIYIIMPIENDKSWHHIALNKSMNETDFYMEDYEINMPATILFDRADKKKDKGRVALAHEASSYVLPGITTNEEEDLKISLDENNNSAGISLIENTLSKASTSRYISFAYPGDADEYGRKSVNKPIDGSVPSATILVKKGNYKIARFKINFIERSPLLTESQLEDDKIGQYTYRQLDYLAENYSLLTTLDFDFNINVPKTLFLSGNNSTDRQQPNKYPYPLSWEESSYAFYDGQKGNINTSSYPEYGYYGIMHDRVNFDEEKSFHCLKGSEGKENTFHMYIDASDDPGRIARLQFKENLCRGAELFVSAWVKNANPYGSSDACDPAMLFTLMGVSGEGNSKTYTPIYRFQTGPIPGTYGGANASNRLPGYNSNDWQQVYFTFTNSSEVDYGSYVLEIDNNSNSTAGGDMYLDDVRIYMMSPHSRVEKKSYICDKQARLFTRIGWDRIVSRFGISDTTLNAANKSTYVAFAFIDSLTFHQTYESNGHNLTDALEAAKVNTRFFTKNDATEFTEYFNSGKVCFSHHFDSNKPYDKSVKANVQDSNVDYTGDNIAETFAYTDEAGEKFLALDLDADLQPLRTYYLLLEGTKKDDERNWNTFHDVTDLCSVKTTFKIESQNYLLIDGELQNPEAKYCDGKLVNFQPILRVDNDGELKTISGARYDWFLGSEEEFLQKWNYNDNEGVWTKSIDDTGVSLHEVIHEFRFNDEYKEITNVDDWHPDGDKSHYPALLKQFGDRWVYNQPFLNTQVSGPSFDLCIHLISTSVTFEDGIICTEPLYATLDVTRKSPTAKVGFYDVSYKIPDADPSYKAAIRIGKGEHIDNIDSKQQLCVPLRSIEQNLKLRDNDSYLYLVDSNDPAVRNIIYNEESFSSTNWPVATITNFTANEGNADSNYIIFYFDDILAKTEGGYGSVDFREGYWYTLLANFEGESPTVSDGDNSSSATNICYGNLVFDMKVVPEYQKWIGAADGTGNWNNDDNWKRSSADELHKTDDKEMYDNTYNYASTYGFVPMFFTNVTVQEKGKVELYTSDKNTTASGNVHEIRDLDNGKPAQIGDATAYIEYDMMVRKATDELDYAYDCIPYYTNTADHIHFEPASEMLHAEKLTYEKAWVDYKLKGARWYTLASPLQAVVAGDWYTLKSGKQTTEYFKDITFSDESYDRQKPSVYQRGWDKSAASMITLSGSNETAISGNWSGVYNDVTVPYDPGQGFSLKTLNLPAETDSALFRLPKADTEYSYKEVTTTKAPVEVAREVGKVGKLMPITSEITVKLQAAGNSGYYLAGNPFMAHLDAKGFFEKNTNLEPKYWLVTDNNQTAAVGTGDDSWTTVDGQTTALIAPLQSFFVQKKSETGSNDVTFTVDMQTLDSGNTSLLRSTSYTEALTLAVTTADGRESRAAVVYNSMASDDYDSSEDAELFLDSNLGDVPAVYTVAGTMAATINQTSELRDIPIGVYGNSDELVTLTFNGVAKFPGTTLYDAKTQRETALFDGSTLTLTANTHGRYFLRAGTPTANEAVATESIHIYTVSDKLIVTSTEDLQTVAVYDFSGRVVYSMDRLSTHSVNIALPKGNYIVKATGRHEEETRKVLIK